MNCPKCGKPALPNAVFCKYCGGRLNEPVQPKPAAKFCAACGAVLIPQAQFCNICGTRVQEELRCAACGAKLAAGSQFCNMCGVRVGIAAQETPIMLTAANPAPQAEPVILTPPEPIPEPMPEPELPPAPEPMPEPEPESEPEPEPEPEPEIEATPVQELAFEKEPIEPAYLEVADACSSCGQKLAPGMLFCTGCGLRLTPREPDKPVHEQMATPLTELAFEKEPVQDPVPASQPEPVPVCASCSAALAPNMKFCTVCGAKVTQPEPVEPITEPLATPLTELVFEKEPVQEPVPASQPEPVPVCASCGAALAPNMKFCTVCGAKATQPEPPSESIKPVATPLAELVFEKEPVPVATPVSGPGRICPSCGAVLAPDATVCNACNDRTWREKWVQS